MKQAEKKIKNKKQNIEEYTSPIDLTNIFCDEGDEDPLYEWAEAGEPVLDE